VDALIAGMARTRTFDRPYLEKIVRTDAKQRYAFNADHTKIRANQGHSIPVDVEPEQLTPPDILWHGTGEKSVAAILSEGLRPMGRLYVHLSKDPETAKKVGSRHGRPVVFQIDARTDGQGRSDLLPLGQRHLDDEGGAAGVFENFFASVLTDDGVFSILFYVKNKYFNLQGWVKFPIGGKVREPFGMIR
jgi:hypothetical protein